MPLTVKQFDASVDYPALAGALDADVERIRAWDARHDVPQPRWIAWHGNRVAGVADVWTSPDGRHRLTFASCDDAAYEPLAAAAYGTLLGPCYLSVDAADDLRIQVLEKAGFAEERREYRFRIPVRRYDAPLRAGLDIRSAADVSPLRLLALDVAIRQLVPGSDGWTADPIWFEEETFGPAFDPATYVVACAGPRLIGLARVWRDDVPRLGLVAVLPAYQRSGVGMAMLARVFDVLADRGVDAVTSEVDSTNTASLALHEHLGAEITGTDIELIYGR